MFGFKKKKQATHQNQTRTLSPAPKEMKTFIFELNDHKCFLPATEDEKFGLSWSCWYQTHVLYIWGKSHKFSVFKLSSAGITTAIKK